MSPLAPPLLDETCDQLDDSLEHSDGTTAADALVRLAVGIGGLRHTGDVAVISSYRGWLDRLIRRHSDQLGSWPSARRQLTELARHLDDFYTQAWQQQEHGEADRRVTIADESGLTLKDRILLALGQSPLPLRPSDLVAATGVDPTQVSRALRQLVLVGKIEQVDSPTTAVDDRARWYAPSARTAAGKPTAPLPPGTGMRYVVVYTPGAPTATVRDTVDGHEEPARVESSAG